MSGQYLQEDYSKRINNVFTYIDEHIDAELSLETIAAVAHYSPYHFHHIFKAITNETLNTYISRKRIEKAAAVLMHKKDTSITDLAFQYGFKSNAAFTRAFKNYFGISPSEFKKESTDRYSKIRKANSKNGEERLVFEQYICNITALKQWIDMNGSVEVKEIPALEVAYLSHVGDKNIEAAFERLMKWARPKGLLDVPDFKMLLIFHDSFKITEADKVRMSVGILLKQPVAVEGEVSLTKIAAGKYIIGRFEIPLDAFEKSWTSLFVWLNEHGYKTTNKPPFEIYHNDFRTHPEKKSIVDMYIPID
jgi:AraC family transcriptional regulator